MKLRLIIAFALLIAMTAGGNLIGTSKLASSKARVSQLVEVALVQAQQSEELMTQQLIINGLVPDMLSADTDQQIDK